MEKLNFEKITWLPGYHNREGFTNHSFDFELSNHTAIFINIQWDPSAVEKGLRKYPYEAAVFFLGKKPNSIRHRTAESFGTFDDAAKWSIDFVNTNMEEIA